jgi:hypothetical protein
MRWVLQQTAAGEKIFHDGVIAGEEQREQGPAMRKEIDATSKDSNLRKRFV